MPTPLSGRLASLAACLPLLLASLQAHALEVLASTHPLAQIAVAVVQGEGQVDQLVPEGVSAHDYALRPSDRVKLARAGVVFWSGPAGEPFLAGVMANAHGHTVQLQGLPGMRLLPQRDPETGRPLPGSLDPHLWLNPDNAATAALALAETLGSLEPARAARYRANAERFTTSLQAQKRQWQQLMSASSGHPYLAYHDAYQYLEQPFGLHFVGAITEGHDQPPGARHLARIIASASELKAGCLLAEPGYNVALAQRVMAGATSRVVAIDEWFTSAPLTAAGYPEGLGTLLNRVASCLKASASR